MSIPIDNLSLLGALAPLRQMPDTNNAIVPQGDFVKRLDEALDRSATSSLGGSSKARELAEALTLQMLQSSLALNTDSASLPGATSLSSVNAFLQAYRDNLAKGKEALAAAPLPASSSSQLQELKDEMPVASPPAISTTSSSLSPSRTDAAWLDPVISRASRKYGVDAGLIKAVIKAESDFNPQAVSHAGARGLMQLMPATARSLGVKDAFDPEQNVMAGTSFLKEMLQRYNGNVDSALAAYNWGPGNVDRKPDRLPHETRDYLARVKQLYSSYSV